MELDPKTSYRAMAALGIALGLSVPTFVRDCGAHGTVASLYPLCSFKPEKAPSRWCDEMIAQMEPVPALLLGRKMALSVATEDQLVVVPGVGPHLARRIVRYQQRHGHIRSPSDLRKVRGIGPKLSERVSLYFRYNNELASMK